MTDTHGYPRPHITETHFKATQTSTGSASFYRHLVGCSQFSPGGVFDLFLGLPGRPASIVFLSIQLDVNRCMSIYVNIYIYIYVYVCHRTCVNVCKQFVSYMYNINIIYVNYVVNNMYYLCVIYVKYMYTYMYNICIIYV